MENKHLCPIHHYMYSGTTCPLCEKDRLENLAHRYVKSPIQEKPKHEEKPREVTEEDLNKLVEKFNSKKK